jgi:condensin-2 complex subunit D3
MNYVSRLQALSIITLAKMCLQNEEMAKKIVPAFGRLLATATEEAAIKNNIVYALSDMCVRYASLVIFSSTLFQIHYAK